MQIRVTDELVRQVATLSRLALSSSAARDLKEHFEKILGYVASFQDLDTSGVDPTHFPADEVNVYRDDEVRESLPVEAALANAPCARKPHFLVPRIVDIDGHGEA